MKQPIPNLKNSFLFLLTVFLLNPPGAVMAGSAAQIASQIEILQDTSRNSQERSAAAQELGVVGLDSDAAAQALVEIIENDSDPKVRASAIVCVFVAILSGLSGLGRIKCVPIRLSACF
jgi:HEAT repeat protein